MDTRLVLVTRAQRDGMWQAPSKAAREAADAYDAAPSLADLRDRIDSILVAHEVDAMTITPLTWALLAVLLGADPEEASNA